MQAPQSLLASFRRFLRDEKAATAIEYAMIAGGISAGIAGLVWTLGEKVAGLFQKVWAAWPA